METINPNIIRTAISNIYQHPEFWPFVNPANSGSDNYKGVGYVNSLKHIAAQTQYRQGLLSSEVGILVTNQRHHPNLKFSGSDPKTATTDNKSTRRYAINPLKIKPNETRRENFDGVTQIVLQKSTTYMRWYN